MSLLDKLANLAEDRSPEVVERIVERAKHLADENLNGPERDIAKMALDKISDKSTSLGHLGAGGLVSLLARFHLGEEDQAEVDYLAQGATFSERLAASRDASEEAIRERVNRERAWAEVRDLLKDLGQIAVKVIPLILMAA